MLALTTVGDHIGAVAGRLLLLEEPPRGGRGRRRQHVQQLFPGPARRLGQFSEVCPELLLGANFFH